MSSQVTTLESQINSLRENRSTLDDEHRAARIALARDPTDETRNRLRRARVAVEDLEAEIEALSEALEVAYEHEAAAKRQRQKREAAKLAKEVKESAAKRAKAAKDIDATLDRLAEQMDAWGDLNAGLRSRIGDFLNLAGGDPRVQQRRMSMVMAFHERTIGPPVASRLRHICEGHGMHNLAVFNVTDWSEPAEGTGASEHAVSKANEHLIGQIDEVLGAEGITA